MLIICDVAFKQYRTIVYTHILTIRLDPPLSWKVSSHMAKGPNSSFKFIPGDGTPKGQGTTDNIIMPVTWIDKDLAPVQAL